MTNNDPYAEARRVLDDAVGEIGTYDSRGSLIVPNSKLHGGHLVRQLRKALSNLLSHVEVFRVDAEVKRVVNAIESMCYCDDGKSCAPCKAAAMLRSLAAERDAGKEHVRHLERHIVQLTEEKNCAKLELARQTAPSPAGYGVTGDSVARSDRADLVEWLRQEFEPQDWSHAEYVEFKEKMCNEAAAMLEADARREVVLAEAIATLLEADARREVALAEAIREVEAEMQHYAPDSDFNDAMRFALAILAKVSAEAQP